MTGNAVQRLAAGASLLRAALADRLFPRPVESVAGLAAFVGTRAAYVAQTALYGYLKTRMGTRFPEYFEDPEFSAAIRDAAVRVFGSCAGDLTLYAVALTGADGRLDAAACAALARRVFPEAVVAGGAGSPATGLVAALAVRADGVLWANALHGMTIFAASAEDVIRFAPVTDAFKALDHDIVRNSVRFRWLNVREQLGRRLDPAAVCADWRSLAGPRNALASGREAT